MNNSLPIHAFLIRVGSVKSVKSVVKILESVVKISSCFPLCTIRGEIVPKIEIRK